MNRKIAILRGINVGGKRKILMAELRTLCESIGLENVVTYIQSGNIIFTSELQNEELENKIEKAITDKYGFDVPVIVRTSAALQDCVAKNPFAVEHDIEHLHLTFLKEKPTTENIEKMESIDSGADEFHIIEQDVFLFCAGKYHQSKLTNNFFEKKLKVGATTRNWKTVLKLVELSKE